jgi:hypothetical protein
MPNLHVLFLQALLLVLELAWVFAPMLTAALFVGPVIGVLLWRTREV